MSSIERTLTSDHWLMNTNFSLTAENAKNAEAWERSDGVLEHWSDATAKTHPGAVLALVTRLLSLDPLWLFASFSESPI